MRKQNKFELMSHASELARSGRYSSWQEVVDAMCEAGRTSQQLSAITTDSAALELIENHCAENFRPELWVHRPED